MRKIKSLAKAIRKELCCANECAHQALRYKDEDKTVGDVFYNLALEHLSSVDKLHIAVTNVIRTVDKLNIPTVMKSIWDFEHEMMIEEQAEIKNCLESYK